MHGTEPCQRSHYSTEFPSIYIQAGKGDVALRTESQKKLNNFLNFKSVVGSFCRISLQVIKRHPHASKLRIFN